MNGPIEEKSLQPRPSAPSARPGSLEYEQAIAASVSAVLARIETASKAVGRNPHSVQLMAVSKFNPPEAVAAAYRAGCRLFGENRVQEALSKFADRAALYPGLQLQLLGHLQSNKAKDAVHVFDCVQSVDSIKILNELDKRAQQQEKRIDVLFELHTGEEAKTGFPDKASLFEAIEHAARLPSLRLRGLMTMAPYTDDEKRIRDSFRACRIAFQEAPCAQSEDWDTLSMGMTNDLELAIAEGSTLVRIGTAIFGRRDAV